MKSRHFLEDLDVNAIHKAGPQYGALKSMLNILRMYLLIHLLYIRCLCAQAVVMEGCSAIQTIQRFGTAQSHLLLHSTVKRTVLLSLREQGDGEKTNNNINSLQSHFNFRFLHDKSATNSGHIICISKPSQVSA